MLFLYVGYLSVQFYSVISVLLNSKVSTFAMIFSIVVLFIFSFIPTLGFITSKKVFGSMFLFKRYSALELILIGVGIGLFEKLLFTVGLLHSKQALIAQGVSFALFFLCPLFNVKNKGVLN